MRAIVSEELAASIFRVELIKGQYLVKNTTDIRIDVIFYD